MNGKAQFVEGQRVKLLVDLVGNRNTGDTGVLKRLAQVDGGSALRPLGVVFDKEAHREIEEIVTSAERRDTRRFVPVLSVIAVIADDEDESPATLVDVSAFQSLPDDDVLPDFSKRSPVSRNSKFQAMPDDDTLPDTYEDELARTDGEPLDEDARALVAALSSSALAMLWCVAKGEDVERNAGVRNDLEDARLIEVHKPREHWKLSITERGQLAVGAVVEAIANNLLKSPAETAFLCGLVRGVTDLKATTGQKYTLAWDGLIVATDNWGEISPTRLGRCVVELLDRRDKATAPITANESVAQFLAAQINPSAPYLDPSVTGQPIPDIDEGEFDEDDPDHEDDADGEILDDDKAVDSYETWLDKLAQKAASELQPVEVARSAAPAKPRFEFKTLVQELDTFEEQSSADCEIEQWVHAGWDIAHEQIVADGVGDLTRVIRLSRLMDGDDTDGDDSSDVDDQTAAALAEMTQRATDAEAALAALKAENQVRSAEAYHGLSQSGMTLGQKALNELKRADTQVRTYAKHMEERAQRAEHQLKLLQFKTAPVQEVKPLAAARPGLPSSAPAYSPAYSPASPHRTRAHHHHSTYHD